MMQRLANNEGLTNLRWGPRYLYGTEYIIEHVFLLQVGTTDCDMSAFGFRCKRIL